MRIIANSPFKKQPHCPKSNIFHTSKTPDSNTFAKPPSSKINGKRTWEHPLSTFLARFPTSDYDYIPFDLRTMKPFSAVRRHYFLVSPKYIVSVSCEYGRFALIHTPRTRHKAPGTRCECFKLRGSSATPNLPPPNLKPSNPISHSLQFSEESLPKP